MQTCINSHSDQNNFHRQIMCQIQSWSSFNFFISASIWYSNQTFSWLATFVICLWKTETYFFVVISILFSNRISVLCQSIDVFEYDLDDTGFLMYQESAGWNLDQYSRFVLCSAITIWSIYFKGPWYVALEIYVWAIFVVLWYTFIFFGVDFNVKGIYFFHLRKHQKLICFYQNNLDNFWSLGMAFSLTKSYILSTYFRYNSLKIDQKICSTR